MAVAKFAKRRKTMSSTWRVLLKMVFWQIAAGAIGGLVIMAVKDGSHGRSFFAGCALMASGWLLAARSGLRTASSPSVALARTLGGLVIRWMWVAAGLVWLLGRWHWPAFPVVLGVTMAELMVIALGAMHRPTSR
jgi:hypothetical protein